MSALFFFLIAQVSHLFLEKFINIIEIYNQNYVKGQTNWAQHDYGHSSFAKTPKVNYYIHLAFIGLIKGASASWWTHLHNQHHAKPNVINKDPDVRIDPVFVLGTKAPMKV